MTPSRAYTPPGRHRSPHRHGRLRWRVQWWQPALILVGLAMGLLVVSRPRVNLAASSTALSKVVLQGWGTHVVAASLTDAPGGPQRLRVAGNILWPAHVLPSDRAVELRVTVAGLFGWRARRVVTVTTPAAPQLASNRLRVDVGKAPAANFRGAVAQVRFPATGHVQAVGGPQVVIGTAPNAPDQHGAVALQVRARPWEPWGSVQTVHWASVPWLTANAHLVTAGHANLSTAPLDVTFSAPVRRSALSHWTLAPAVAGRWHRATDRTWHFQPTGRGWAPDTTIVLHLPRGKHSLVARDGAMLAQASHTLTVQLPQGTTLRLQQWLAELGYLPLRWTPTVGARAGQRGWDSVYQPPAGSFTWRYPAVPSALKSLWNPTYWTAMTQAAVIAFQHQQHLPVNGIPGPQVWMALQQAVRHHAVNPTPYAYVYVSETLPERLWLWVAGHVVLTTLANTGIPETPTTLGSYAVDERRPFQIMRGINPNGTSYADPVHWINYFDKSQAVHGFLRAQYGFPQSLGCVEVPIPVAQKIYPHLYIGALVTVEPPGSAPLVRPNSAAQ